MSKISRRLAAATAIALSVTTASAGLAVAQDTPQSSSEILMEKYADGTTMLSELLTGMNTFNTDKETGGFWNPDADKSMQTSVNYMNELIKEAEQKCKDATGEKKTACDETIGKYKAEHDAYATALGLFRMELVAVIVLPLLAIVGGMKVAQDQGMIPRILPF